MNLNTNGFSPERPWWSVRGALLVILGVMCLLCAIATPWIPTIAHGLPDDAANKAGPQTSTRIAVNR